MGMGLRVEHALAVNGYPLPVCTLQYICASDLDFTEFVSFMLTIFHVIFVKVARPQRTHAHASWPQHTHAHASHCPSTSTHMHPMAPAHPASPLPPRQIDRNRNGTVEQDEVTVVIATNE